MLSKRSARQQEANKQVWLARRAVQDPAPPLACVAPPRRPAARALMLHACVLQAQQRYRNKRKAQFKEMSVIIDQLGSRLRQAQVCVCRWGIGVPAAAACAGGMEAPSAGVLAWRNQYPVPLPMWLAWGEVRELWSGQEARCLTLRMLRLCGAVRAHHATGAAPDAALALPPSLRRP